MKPRELAAVTIDDDTHGVAQLELSGPADARVVGVLLHPHPHHGGDRFHPLIDGCYAELPAHGWGAVRFDFSSADPDTACEETRAALAAAEGRWPDASTVLAGYSFGASMAIRVVDGAVTGWFLVAPPLVTIGDAAIARDPRPKRLVIPEHDQFSSLDGMAAATATWCATELRVMPGDHYLFGTLAEVIDECVAFCAMIECQRDPR